jgi:hypothetical protein
MKKMNRFYITPSVFWEIEDNRGRFTIAWLFIHLDIKFKINEEDKQ